MKYDFTEGSITKKLFLFVLPILLSLILQQLYGAILKTILFYKMKKSNKMVIKIHVNFISMFIRKGLTLCYNISREYF